MWTTFFINLTKRLVGVQCEGVGVLAEQGRTMKTIERTRAITINDRYLPQQGTKRSWSWVWREDSTQAKVMANPWVLRYSRGCCRPFSAAVSLPGETITNQLQLDWPHIKNRMRNTSVAVVSGSGRPRESPLNQRTPAGWPTLLWVLGPARREIGS